MPKIVDKKAKKLDILHAAAKVFAEKGVVKTKMMDIAEEAGIGKGTIYEYYRSKEQIFADTFRMMIDQMEQQIGNAIGQIEDPVLKLEKVIQITLKEFLEHSGDLAGIMMDFWAEGVRTKSEDVINLINLEQLYSEYRMMIADILHDGINKDVFRPIDAQSLASLVIGSMDGVMLQWIMNKEIIDLDKVSKVLLDTVLYGIKK